MESKPEIQVLPLESNDPTFEPSTTKTARAQMLNPTTKQFTYDVELYLGASKVATSGVGSITIPAGGSQYVDFTIVMPAVEGTYPVCLDVSYEGELLAHYQATEDVVIEVSPAINIGPITWV